MIVLWAFVWPLFLEITAMPPFVRRESVEAHILEQLHNSAPASASAEAKLAV